MIENVTYRSLIDLGLTEREAKLYLALLGRPEATPAELQRLSGIIRNKTYETLDQMVLRGYCRERVAGRRRFFSPTDPETLKETIRKRLLDELDEKENRLIQEEYQRLKQIKQEVERKELQLKEEIEKKRSQYKSDVEKKLSIVDGKEEVFEILGAQYQQLGFNEESIDKIEVIRNPYQLSMSYINMLNEAKKEILSFVRSPFASMQTKESHQGQSDALHGAMKRGIIFKSLYMFESKLWESMNEMPGDKNRDEDEDHILDNEEVRIVKELPVKMCIIDRKKVMFTLRSPKGDINPIYSSLIVEDVGMVQMCYQNFLNNWEKGYSLEEWRKKMDDEFLIP